MKNFTRFGKKIRNNKGQSIVELALLLPILLMLLFGTIEFGRVYGAYMIINHASREAVRVGSVGGTTSEIQTAVANTTSALDQSKISIQVTKSGLGARGDTVAVLIGYDISIVGPLIGVVVPNPLHLESQMSMRIE